jgi:hypothetical protein
MATQTTTTPKVVQHASQSTVVAVASAHGENDAAIAARITAVSMALAEGTDVKTLTADLRAAEKAGITDADGNPIQSVSASILGYAKGTLTVLDKMGVSLPKRPTGAQVAVLADTYRAIKRHGSKVAVPDLAGIAVQGKTTADKFVALGKAAKVSRKAAVQPGATRKPRAGAGSEKDTKAATVTTKAATTEEAAKLLALMADSIAKGRIVPDAAFTRALENVVAEAKKAAIKAARVTPATVARSTAKAAA